MGATSSSRRAGGSSGGASSARTGAANSISNAETTPGGTIPLELQACGTIRERLCAPRGSQRRKLRDLIVDQDDQRGIVRRQNPIVDVRLERLKLGDRRGVVASRDVPERRFILCNELCALRLRVARGRELGIRQQAGHRSAGANRRQGAGQPGGDVAPAKVGGDREVALRHDRARNLGETGDLLDKIVLVEAVKSRLGTELGVF